MHSTLDAASLVSREMELRRMLGDERLTVRTLLIQTFEMRISVAFFLFSPISLLVSTPTTPCAPATCTLRHYYIAINDVLWDYAPSDRDNVMGVPLASSPHASMYTVAGPGRIGKKIHKRMYRGYTDDTFTKEVQREPWMGGLGPVLRMEVGDVVKVTIWNNATGESSIYPHGVRIDSGDDMDGSRKLKAGEKKTVTWIVPESAGPSKGSGEVVGSRAWMYHSDVDETKDVNAGLVGPLVVYSRGGLAKALRDDYEIFILMTITDENQSPLLAKNVQEFAGNTTSTTPGSSVYDLGDPDFVESNLKHGVNFRLFANLDGMTFPLGARVRWYVGSIGGEKDLHTAHWHGASLIEAHGRRVDVANLLPGDVQSLVMTTDAVGRWLMHCHVNDHIKAGMIVIYEVKEKDAKLQKQGMVDGALVGLSGAGGRWVHWGVASLVTMGAVIALLL